MDLKKFLINQKIEIEKYKWVESQKANRDLGEQAVTEWVNKNAKKYREEYEETYNALIKETADECKKKLAAKFPTVSDQIWEHFVKTVVDSFTQNWTKDVCCCKDAKKKKHLEEI
jgi:hypothetical protein